MDFCEDSSKYLTTLSNLTLEYYINRINDNIIKPEFVNNTIIYNMQYYIIFWGCLLDLPNVYQDEIENNAKCELSINNTNNHKEIIEIFMDMKRQINAMNIRFDAIIKSFQHENQLLFNKKLEIQELISKFDGDLSVYKDNIIQCIYLYLYNLLVVNNLVHPLDQQLQKQQQQQIQPPQQLLTQSIPFTSSITSLSPSNNNIPINTSTIQTTLPTIVNSNVTLSSSPIRINSLSNTTVTTPIPIPINEISPLVDIKSPSSLLSPQQSNPILSSTIINNISPLPSSNNNLNNKIYEDNNNNNNTSELLCVSCHLQGTIELHPCKHLLCQACKRILSEYYVHSTEPSACPLCKTRIQEYIDTTVVSTTTANNKDNTSTVVDNKKKINELTKANLIENEKNLNKNSSPAPPKSVARTKSIISEYIFIYIYML